MKLLNRKYALLPYSKSYLYFNAFVVKSYLVENSDFLFTWVKPMNTTIVNITLVNPIFI